MEDDGGRWTEAKLKKEREAWKAHFQKVSRRKEHVAERVWGTVEAGERIH